MSVKRKSSAVMMCRAYAWMPLLRFTAFLVGVASECPKERPGYCNTGNDANLNFNPSNLVNLCALNCDFEESLCWYAQGCVDQSMTNWTAVNGSALADQVGGGCGAASFSMLESPWVLLDRPETDMGGTTAGVSCLRFSFRRRLPYGLDVFWMASDGNVTTLLNRMDNIQTEANYTHEFTLSEGAGKLLFRLYGGGGFSGQGERKLLLLYEVTHHGGQCLPSGTGCSFDSVNQSDQFCHWTNVNWETGPSFLPNNTVAAFSMGRNSSEPATLTTPFIRPTNSVSKTDVDCLTFDYMVNGSSNSSLTVKIHLMNGQMVTLWRVLGPVIGNTSLDEGKQVIASGAVPIVSPYAYKVVFEGLAMPTDEIGLDNIKITTTTRGYCQRQPVNSSVDSLPTEALEYCDSKGNLIILTTTTVATDTTTMSTSTSVSPLPSSTSSPPTLSYVTSQITTSPAESSSSLGETTVVDTTTTSETFTSTLPTIVNTTGISDASSSANSTTYLTTLATRTEDVSNSTSINVTQNGVTSDIVTLTTDASSTVPQSTLTNSTVPQNTLTSTAVPQNSLTSSAASQTTLAQETSSVVLTSVTGGRTDSTTRTSSLQGGTGCNFVACTTTAAKGDSEASYQQEKKDRDVAIIVGVILGVVGLIVLCLAAFCIIRHCRLSNKYNVHQKNSTWTTNDRNGEIALYNAAGTAMEY